MATARYLGVAPWDLAAQPVAWLEAGQAAMAAEQHARTVQERKAARRGRSRQPGS